MAKDTNVKRTDVIDLLNDVAFDQDKITHKYMRIVFRGFIVLGIAAAICGVLLLPIGKIYFVVYSTLTVAAAIWGLYCNENYPGTGMVAEGNYTMCFFFLLPNAGIALLICLKMFFWVKFMFWGYSIVCVFCIGYTVVYIMTLMNSGTYASAPTRTAEFPGGLAVIIVGAGYGLFRLLPEISVVTMLSIAGFCLAEAGFEYNVIRHFIAEYYYQKYKEEFELEELYEETLQMRESRH